MSVLQFKKRKIPDDVSNNNFPVVENKSSAESKLHTLADLCEVLCRQEESKKSLTANSRTTSSEDDDDLVGKVDTDDEGDGECLPLHEDDDEEDDETEGEKSKDGSEEEIRCPLAATLNALAPACYQVLKKNCSLFRKALGGGNASSSQASKEKEKECLPHYLYPEIPRILKRDIRRKYSLMFVNVMNSYNTQLVDAFIRKFTTDDIVLHSKTQIPGITGRDFDVISLEGMDTVIAFLASLQQIFPDLLLEVKEAKLKQTLPSLETRVVSRIRWLGTFLYDADTYSLADSIKKGYSLACCNPNCQGSQKTASTNMNGSFHYCDSLRSNKSNICQSASPLTHSISNSLNGTSPSSSPASTASLKSDETGRQNLFPTDMNDEPLQPPLKKIKIETGGMSEEDASLKQKMLEEVNSSMKLRCTPKYCELDGVLYFHITEAKKIQKIVFVGKKKKFE